MGKYFMLNDLANKREYPLEIKQKSQVSIATRILQKIFT